MLPSSVHSLWLMSNVALKVVPPTLAVVAAAYVVSSHLGANPAPGARMVVVNDRGALPLGSAMDVITAGHDAARAPAPVKPRFEPRERDIAIAEPAASAQPPARAKAMREASAKHAHAGALAADKAMPLPPPPPLQIADATPIEPVVEPRQARVLGMPVPRFVSRTGEKVVDAANAMRPTRLISAGWELSKQAANKVASAASAIVP